VELHLPRPRTGQPADARTRPLHQRRVQQGPPFSSRKSPNPPTVKSPSIAIFSTADTPAQRFRPIDPRQERCVHTIAAFAGMTPSR
jgi:hypothetical protein